MRPIRRLLALSASLMVLLASGCALTPQPVPSPYDERVVLEIPSDSPMPDAVIPVIEARLNALGAQHDVSTSGATITADFTAGDVPVPTSVFWMPGEFSLRPVLESGIGNAADCMSATLDEPCRPAESYEPLDLDAAALWSEHFLAAEPVEVVGQAGIEISLNDDGTAILEDVTVEIACRPGEEKRIAVLIDGNLLAAPSIAVPCGEADRSPYLQAYPLDSSRAEAYSAVLNNPGVPPGTEVVARD